MRYRTKKLTRRPAASRAEEKLAAGPRVATGVRGGRVKTPGFAFGAVTALTDCIVEV